MNVSTAVRKGSKGMRQLQGAMLDGPRENPTGCCVIAAAWLGAGGGPDLKGCLQDLLPQTMELVETEDEEESIRTIMFYQNDILGWSFTEIADWLEYYGY